MNDYQEALAFLRARTSRTPDTALVLGSGLGALADAASDAERFATADIPGYPQSTVAGHAGQLVFGTLGSREVLFIQGRVHYYEGHDVRATTFPIRLAHALGVSRLVLTNAAGGINRRYAPGTLMLIDDHLNMAGASPLAGPVGKGEPRFADMSAPYSPAWLGRAEAEALKLGIAVERGVYAWTAGPSYETPAEVRMLALLGADAVGMSTVPEALQAVSLGMEVLGISTITNKAAGLGEGQLNHEEVLAVGQQVRIALEKLVRAVV